MTAREPSAVEVIAEDALVARVKRVTGHVPVGFRDLLHVLMHPDVVDYTLAALKAAGFVVATRDEIRAMSPTEQADLIGAGTQSRRLIRGGPREQHVVGPWREVQP